MHVSIEHPTDRPNYSVVTIGDVELHFSYATVIGFRAGFDGYTVRENDWGPTTGRHLNMIPSGSDKAARLPAEAFEARLASALSGIGAEVAR